MPKLAAGALVVLASASVGGFVGWLVGASSTPVVATVVPLVFALATVLWQRYAELRDTLRAAVATANAKGDAEGVAVLRAGAPTQDGLAAIAVTSLATIAFVAAAYAGVQHGVGARVPTLPPLAALVGGDTTLDYREKAILARLRLDLARMNLDADETREVFNTVVVPLLRDRSFAAGGRYADIRADALKEVTRQFVADAGAARASRSPASEAPPTPDSTDRRP